MPTITSKICVYTAANAIEGNLIRGLLESEGIDVELRGEMSPYPGVPRASETRIFVPHDQHTRAAGVIARYENHAAEQKHWRCDRCGESNTSAFETCWQCQQAAPLDATRHA